MKIHNLINPLYWLESFTFYGGGKGRGGFSDVRNVRTTDAAEPMAPPIVDPIEPVTTGGEPPPRFCGLAAPPGVGRRAAPVDPLRYQVPPYRRGAP